MRRLEEGRLTEPLELDLSGIRPLDGTRTVEQSLARELHDAIVKGRLPPGTRLPYRELARQFGVSVTPVRIALRELREAGLIESRPHGGARVAPLSIGELEEIYTARIGFEAWLAKTGAEALEKGDLVELERALRGLKAAAQTGDVNPYLAAAWNHRMVCYRAAKRPALLERVETLFERSHRYNWLTLGDDGRLDESRASAYEFDAACHTGDGEQARAVLRRILDRSLEHLVERFAYGDHGLPREPTAADN
jgi:DNA-binding GntR family transcriptional regulator